jgi:peptidoglycan/xylan/chitin deacetylase (PgdA/CDA1 family)
MTLFCRIITVLLALLCASGAVNAQIALCPGNPNALGTSRTIALAPHGVRVGTKQFPNTLALKPREVVLTFDDGPHPTTTAIVLKALAHECVKATFFLIGREAAARPDIVRRIAAEGHTVAYHSMTHPMTLAAIPYPVAVENIERGITAVDGALGHSAAPFFRFPGFGSSPALLSYLERKGYAVFGADLWASDWNVMTPNFELALVMQRLEQTGGGIFLFHDTQIQTARMLPAFLAALKAGGWTVAHVVPAQPARSEK